MGEMDLVLTIGMFELLRRQHGANIAMATTNNAPSLAVGFTAKNGGYPGDGKI